MKCPFRFFDADDSCDPECAWLAERIRADNKAEYQCALVVDLDKRTSWNAANKIIRRLDASRELGYKGREAFSEQFPRP